MTETRMPNERRQGTGQIKDRFRDKGDEVAVRNLVVVEFLCVIEPIMGPGPLGIALERIRL